MVLHPMGSGLVLVIIPIALFVCAALTVGTRSFVRLRLKAFGLDDWLMVVGLALFTVECAVTVAAAFNGVGAHADRLNEYYEQEGRKWFLFFQLFYLFSTIPIKASICVALLRITNRPAFRYILYGVIVLSTVAMIIVVSVILARCQPIEATWNPKAGTCDDITILTNVSFFFSACSILTDWACAILPAFILKDVQLKVSVKGPVMVVLALGVFASCATLVRLRYLLNYNTPADYLYGLAGIAMWSTVECGIGIIAGSLATLRPLLKYIPFLAHVSTHDRTTRTNRSGISHSHVPQSSHNIEMLRFHRGFHNLGEAADGKPDVEDGDSQKYILKQDHIVITNEPVDGKMTPPVGRTDFDSH